MVHIPPNNNALEELRFRNTILKSYRHKSPTGLHSTKASYVLQSIKTLLEEENNFYALEILRTLENALKPHMEGHDKKESTHVALLCLLTKNEKDFLYTQDNNLSHIFYDCPFTERMKIVKLTQQLKEELPALCRNEVLKLENFCHVNKTSSFTRLQPVKKVSPNKHFYKPIKKIKNNEERRPSLNFELNIEKDDLAWLKNEYMKYQSLIPGLSWEDFADSLLQTLSSNKSDDELQNELIEMLGFDLFELIASILGKRQAILEAFENETKKSAENFKKELLNGVDSTNVVKPTFMKNEIEMPQKLRNLQEIVERLDIPDAHLLPNDIQEVLSSLITKKKDVPIKKSVVKSTPIANPNIHDQQLDIARKMMVCGRVANVPFDAIVKHTELYDEITIPPRKTDVPLESISKVQIENLDSVGKMVFKDIRCFNHIQSEVFDVAYNTNENMLVCAPTGSGKTNIALMTIVNLAKSFIENNVLHLEKFKIVYICPMKALAAEMAQNFSRKLACLGLNVKELTGDIQMSRKEILETQMLVTTPEKWDVISRKGTADVELTSLVKLLIIDEVHLLNTDRGPVIEALVARTLRQVLTSQNMIRIVGLSATLPSYMDVGQFLRVNPDVGLFYFDNRYRSVPLIQTFVGIKSTKLAQSASDLDEACFEKVISFLRDDHQVLVFVHARNQTVRTANFLKDTASKRHLLQLFAPADTIQAKKIKWDAGNSTNKVIEDLLAHGLGVHHAGLLRRDRSATEKQFINGAIKVLVCTATLAWGVNLPAHGVVIKGTEIYDSKRGSFVDLDILDVLQIFGRAGRPQYDTSGHGIIITANDKVHFYLSALTNQLPIESNLMKALPDNLNAEIVLGTISNIQEAVEWLTFTYMHRRMRVNPHVYGLLPKDLYEDPSLRGHLLDMAHKAAQHLDKAHMVRYDTATGELISTYLGRTASYFYVTLPTIENFNEKISRFMTEADIIYMMCSASEFTDMQVRPDELEDLDNLLHNYCEFPVASGVENTNGKVYVLMQTYLSRGYIKSISLASDMEFINQSSVRIARALFDIAIHQNNATLAGRCLMVAQSFERQMWPFQTPVRQFPEVPISVIETIEDHHINLQDLKEMDAKDLGHLVRNHRTASHLKRCVDAFPLVEIESTLHPITRGVLRVKLFITPKFVWNDKLHGKGCENFWLWVEDPENDTIYHSETCAITKAVCMKEETLELVFTVPLVEPRPSQYLVRVCNDRWMHATNVHPLSFRDLYIPTSFTPHTELLELRPLAVEALNNPVYEGLYKFSHFNPVQTQIFHCLYHRDDNVLLGAPTGSGKTIAAEICVFRLFNKNTNLKVVYIAPMKALVRERVEDWKIRFGGYLGKNVIEMTGDVTPNAQVIKSADIIITTPEKWDGLSRGWQNRRYIQQVGLIIIDEIHLLGEDRGPVLEVIVSRINFIANQTGIKPRIIGLSTAMANAGNLGNWLGIDEIGLYNFRPSVRPVPLDAHIMGFHGKHYCPRMISMNRPAYQAIRQFAPNSPTLIFCSSRKQTRITAIDLITYLLTDADSKRWLHCEEGVMEYIVSNVSDTDLKHFLLFGIGIHHAGLQERDRKTVEELFVNQKIQVLIATATLAWGVNFPAHLVIIKGTEYFDGKTKRYIDMPITDVLQMMGRAGRPQFDTSGVACVFVQDIKKNFYKKFLYEPFPIESNLMQVLPDHINAEIASGTITTKDTLMEYMTWTYFFRRLLENPSYYNLAEVEPSYVQQFLSDLVDAVVDTLVDNNCVMVNDEVGVPEPSYLKNRVIMDKAGKGVFLTLSASGSEARLKYEITFYGQVASFYYLSYKTVAYFQEQIKCDSSIMELLQIMCRSEEYATFPVRHNEDKINKEVAQEISYDLNGESCESSHVKVALLIHTYLSNFEFPNQEYLVDFKSAMDQAFRILQAMADIASNNSWLSCTLKIIHIMQMLIQGQYLYDPVLLTVPHITTATIPKLEREIEKHLNIPEHNMNLLSLKIVSSKKKSQFEKILSSLYDVCTAKEIFQHISNLPLLDISITVLDINQINQKIFKNKPKTLTLEEDEHYEFLIHIKKFGSTNLTVNAPRFPKKKEEGWFVCLGDIEHDYLIDIKRITVVKQSRCSFTITAPKPGKYTFAVLLMSDSYLGLDQQYNIPVNVVQSAQTAIEQM